MADKIGDVYYEAHIRGDDLNKEARALGQKSGAEMGTSARKSFQTQFSKLSQELIPELRRQGRVNGNVFTSAFEGAVQGRIRGLAGDIANIFSSRSNFSDFVSGFDNVDDAVKKLRLDMQELNGVGALNDQMWNRLGGTLNNYLGEHRQLTAAQDEENRLRRESINGLSLQIAEESNATESKRNLNRESERQVGAFERLANRIKQARGEQDRFGGSTNGVHRRMTRLTKIILLVTAALPELAVLSSAAGAGLTVLGGAAAVAVAGIGVAIAALVGLNKPLSELPAGVRPAAQAFQDFRSVLSQIQDAIQLGAVFGLTNGFNALAATGRALLPVFQAFGATVGQVFATFAQSIAPGTEGFAKLQFFLEKSQPIFTALASAVLSLGSALGSIFIALAPFIQSFATFLADITAQFAAWAESAAGQTQLQEWAASAQIIFEGLMEVLGAVSTTLSTVVTPAMVAQFADFLSQLAGFMPVVTELINIIAKLNIFGIIGQLFESLGPVVSALAPVLGRIATALGEGLVVAVKTLGPLLLGLAHALTPLLDALLPIIPLVLQLATDLIAALLPALQPLIDAFIQLVPPILQIVQVLIAALMPIITPLIALLGELLGPILQPLVFTFQVLAAVLLALAPVLTLIGEIVGAVIGTIVALFTGDFTKIGEIWTEVWNHMLDWVKQTVAFILPVIQALIRFFTDAFNNIGKFFTAFATNFARGWEALWNGAMGILRGIWNGILGFIEGGINGAIDLINGLLKGINNVGGAIGIHLGLIPKLRIPRLAAGGIITQRLQAVLGEAGPEMVVPLRRPLSQVDPAVRPVAAFAQGLPGSGGGPQKVVNIEAGAFSVITPATNPVIITTMVMDAVVDKALN